jgi:hypothetical protein
MNYMNVIIFYAFSLMFCNVDTIIVLLVHNNNNNNLLAVIFTTVVILQI